MSDLVVYGVFAAWFALCAVRQTRFRVRTITTRDWLGLVPGWGYFQDPWPYDYAVVSRYVDEHGRVTHKELIEFDRPRSRLAALWNPDVSRRKSLRDAVGLMLRADRRGNRQRLFRHHGYLAILDRASKAVSESKAIAVQFVVVAYREYDPTFPAFVMFASEFHLLSK